jgi:RNA polymerase sigma factor (sigma-70 family)
MVTKINKMNRALEELRKNLERNPTDEELVTRLEWTKGALQRVRESERFQKTGSLDKAVSDEEGGGTLMVSLKGPTSSDPTDQALSNFCHEVLLNVLAVFPDRERQVMELHLGLTGDCPLPLAEIGKRLRIPREQVRQIVARGERHLKEPELRQILKKELEG